MRREPRGEPFAHKSRDRAPPATNSLSSLIGRAHTEGTLNLSNRGLTSPPPEIFNVSLCGEAVKFWEVSPLIKLDLSFNDLQTVPPDVGLLNDLQIFKARHNELRDLAPEFWGCLKLRHLDLAQNKISVLDSGVGQLTDLKELLVFENSLSRIPESLVGLQQLQVLDVSRNKLTAFSPMVLPALVSLNVSHNLLQNLPDELSSFTSLQSLDCKANRLLGLPDLSRLSQLLRIDAMENKIAAMPGLPCALTFLNLGSNSLQSIDSHTLLHQTNLSELHLAGNQLMLLEPALLDSCRLTIKVIDVSCNSLPDLPDCLGHAPLLHKILASGNPIRAIRQSLLSSQAAGATERLKEYLRTRGPGGGALTTTVFHQASRGGAGGGGAGGGGGGSRVLSSTDEKVHSRIRDSRIDSVDLSALQMSCLADASARLQASPHLLDESQQNVGIIRLSLALNAFEHFPPELFSMPALQALDLSSNRLGLGSSTSHVVSILPPSLTCIDLSKNNLAVLPLLSTPRLQVLNLSINCITELSSSIQTLSHLRELTLSNNRIRSLAGIDWARFSSLETLNLRDNLLQGSILCLHPVRTLQTLLLDNNNLSFEGDTLPTFLGRLDRLQALSFHGNPQRVVRMAILDKGTEAIKEFLRLRE